MLVILRGIILEITAIHIEFIFLFSVFLLLTLSFAVFNSLWFDFWWGRSLFRIIYILVGVHCVDIFVPYSLFFNWRLDFGLYCFHVDKFRVLTSFDLGFFLLSDNNLFLFILYSLLQIHFLHGNKLYRRLLLNNALIWVNGFHLTARVNWVGCIAVTAGHFNFFFILNLLGFSCSTLPLLFHFFQLHAKLFDVVLAWEITCLAGFKLVIFEVIAIYIFVGIATVTLKQAQILHLVTAIVL